MKLIIPAAISLLLFGTTATFYVLALVRPSFFLDPKTFAASVSTTWKELLFYGITILGTGLCIHSGMQDLLHWIPNNLHAVDYDGDGYRLSTAISGFVGSVGGLFLPLCVAQLAVRAAEAERKLQSHWQ